MPVIFVLAALLAALPALVTAQAVHLEGSAGMSTGRYLFAERTTTWSASAGLSVTQGVVTVRATLPAYFQNSTLVAGSGTGYIPTGGSSGQAVADSGAARKGRGSGGMAMALAADPVDVPASATGDYQFAVGDPIGSVSARVIGTARTSVSLSGFVKVPVTDTASFGTGAWDGGAGVSVLQNVGRGTFLGLDVSYWELGDTPDLPLGGTLLGSGSLTTLLGDRWALGVSASAATAVVEGFDPPVSVGASINRLGSGGGWGIFASAGLTETAADVSVGMSWRTGI